jgi:membrane-associated phospholipid phosphatase
MAGGFYTVGKWAVARTRPIVGNGIFINRPFGLHFFPDGLLGIFASRPDRSFPSGHTCLAFATAMALAIFIPRWRVAFLVIAACVGLERVLEDAHYMSDVVAGAGLGALAAILTRFLYERAFSQWSPVARSLRLGAMSACRICAIPVAKGVGFLAEKLSNRQWALHV